MQKKTSFNHKLSLLLFAFLFCLFIAIIIFWGIGLPAQYEDTFLGEMKYKLERLKTIEGKRIVVIGGSSVPFALKSDLIAAQFPEYEVVDFGMYASLGTIVMLDWAANYIHEGDIIIIMPEQNPQTLSNYISGETIWQATDGDLSLVTLLPSSYLEKLLASFPIFAGKKFFSYLNPTPEATDIYARSSFNNYGDIDYPNRTYNIMSNKYNPNDTISFSFSAITTDFIEKMNDFSILVKEKGATVYYHFPPMNELALEEDVTKSSVDAYYDFLTQQLQFPILGNPHTSILESYWFYDTNFHLNDSGAILFSRNLIDDLKILFQDTSVTEINIPTKPMVPILSIVGDNSNTDFFTYEQTDLGWFIIELTQKGLEASQIVIPTTYENQSVVGISDTLFVNNTTLRELTLQPNIGTIYDNMFLGATNFEKLILTGVPSDYSIGDQLMSNLNFFISVPNDSFDNYKRHYSWQKYSSYFVTNP